MTRTVSGGRQLQRRPRSISTIVVVTVLGLFAAYFFIPLWWLAVTVTKRQGSVATSNGLWFDGFHLWANIQGLFSFDDGIFARWLFNSTLYAGLGAFAATFGASMAGYCLAKYSFWGRHQILKVVLGSVMVPSAVLALPLFLLFARIHGVDTIWSVLLPGVVSPFGVFIARIAAAGSVPDAVIDAARLDGAGEFRVFFSIGARLMLPGIVTVFLFSFVAIWNNFFLPLIMLQTDQRFPVTLGLYFWSNQATTTDPHLEILVIVGSFVSTAPLMILAVLLQRYWRSGLSFGAVTG